MTTYIVKDPTGCEVWRGDCANPSLALDYAWARGRVHSAHDLMLAAGYTVEEAVEMIEVGVDDLEKVLSLCPGTPYYHSDILAVSRLRALVAQHRGRK